MFILRFIAIPFFLLTTLFVRSQPYFPIPTDSVSWKAAEEEYSTYPNGFKLYQHQYQANGDTIINSLFYTRLTDSSEHEYYYGAYREDTSRKVFYVPRDSTKEFLLYDFSVEVGDTITGLYNSNADTLIVQHIEIKPVNEQPLPGLGRKIIEVNDIRYPGGSYSLSGMFWVEGIGSNAGFIDANYEIEFDNSRILECFRYKGQSYLFKTNCNPVGLEEIQPGAVHIQAPNPFNGISSVSIQNAPPGTTCLHIYNSAGQLVYTDAGKHSTFFELNSSDFQKGLYIFVVQTADGKVYPQKIIVQ